MKTIKSIADYKIRIYFLPEDKYKATKEIVNIIENANKNIYILSYFFTKREFINSIIKAKQKNPDLDIKIILNSSNLSKGLSNRLKRFGINDIILYNNKKQNIHSKVVIVDDVVITGSYNFSKKGRSNFENILIINNKKIANAYKKRFLKLYNYLKNKTKKRL